MAKKYENRIILITRETRLQKVLLSQNTVSQAKFYISRLGGDFDDYQQEHQRYCQALLEIKKDLDPLANIQILERRYLSNFVFDKNDIVIALGQDGLVANTMKYLDLQPLIGINPDINRWDGILLPFAPEDAAAVTEETIKGKRKTAPVSMAKVRVQNGQELYAVNDFFIGQKTHTSARYILKYEGYKEPQSSSGIIISTGLGSTGWMKSIIAGAKRISSSVIASPYGSLQERDLAVENSDEETDFEAGAQDAKIQAKDAVKKEGAAAQTVWDAKKTVSSLQRKTARKKKEYGISELSEIIGKWESRELIFAVREPFPSKTTGTTLVFGKIPENRSLKIESLMGNNGVIFSDGIESDFITFNSGTEAVVSLAQKQGRLII